MVDGASSDEHDLESRIEAAQAAATELAALTGRLAAQPASEAAASATLDAAIAACSEAEDRAEALSGAHVEHLLHVLRGDAGSQGEQAEQAAAAGRERVATLRAALASIHGQGDADRTRADDLRSQVATLGSLRDELALARWHAAGDARAGTFAQLLTTERSLDEQDRQLTEADSALAAARSALTEMTQDLSSAHAWGTYDTWFGGGIVASAVKHNRIDSANDAASRLRGALDRLRSELADVRLDATDLQISGGRRTMDIWFDNIFTDASVQADIKEQQDRAADLDSGLSQVAAKLAELRAALVTDRAAAAARRATLLPEHAG